MDNATAFIAADWFIAGYLAAHSDVEGLPDWDVIYVARQQAFETIDQHRAGGCIGCGREGIVLLDGFFCERCSPGVSEYLEERE